jgi:hypothetical protein
MLYSSVLTEVPDCRNLDRPGNLAAQDFVHSWNDGYEICCLLISVLNFLKYLKLMLHFAQLCWIFFSIINDIILFCCSMRATNYELHFYNEETKVSMSFYQKHFLLDVFPLAASELWQFSV